MSPLPKYIVSFLLYFIIFCGVLCLIDWKTLDLDRFYMNLVQGIFFGLFMTFYDYWSSKRKKKKENKEHQEEKNV